MLAVVLFPRAHHRGAKPHKADQSFEPFREQIGVSREGQAEELLRTEREGPRNKSQARAAHDLMPLMAAVGIHGSLATATTWSAHWRPKETTTQKKAPGDPGAWAAADRPSADQTLVSAYCWLCCSSHCLTTTESRPAALIRPLDSSISTFTYAGAPASPASIAF